MQKRGFFFTLDALLALSMLSIVVFIMMMAFLSVPEPEQTRIIAEDTLRLLTTSRISDLDDTYAGVNGELWQQGKITNAQNTLIQQIGEFKAKGDTQYVEPFFLAVTKDRIPAQYYTEVRVDDMRLSPLSPSDAFLESEQRTGLLIAKEVVAFGILNETTAQLWGPSRVQIKVWQR